MQTSAYLNYRNTVAGFTLVEILVVLLIVTILAGLTVTRLPAFARSADFDTEVRRIELLFSMARTEAILDSSEFGFRLSDTGYQFSKFDDASQSWRDAASPFQHRELPGEFRLTIRSDNDDFRLAGEKLPPILILSSGETTPFDLILESKTTSETRIFSSDGYGEFRWRDDD